MVQPLFVSGASNVSTPGGGPLHSPVSRHTLSTVTESSSEIIQGSFVAVV